MTSGPGSTETLSRFTAHLENLANILSFLGGGATLLHELTQNANDAGANTVTFTATAAELTVWNSSVFSDCGSQRESDVCPWKAEKGRSCDLHSFREIGGRHKAWDDTTTGAFGIGFTAVYQVTDHPELVTSGWHWTLDEARPEADRITICTGGCGRDHTTGGTTFYLPWVRTSSELRNRLGAAPLTDADIKRLIEQMHDAAPNALVFLEHVESLEIHSVGADSIVRRSRTDDRITITVNEADVKFLLLEGEAAGADELKAQSESKYATRLARVQVAIPAASEAVGLVFADLPTETRTGWQGHLNGTFFPMPDRKNVEFGAQSFPGQWNDLLVDAAAALVAANVESIAAAQGDQAVWQYLVDAEQVNREIESGKKYPDVFAALFERAKAAVPSAHIALLSDERRVPPSGALVPRDEEEYQAVEALTKLGLDVLHPTIRPQARQISLTQYGMRYISVADVVQVLSDADIFEGWSASPETALSDSDVEDILQLLQHLQERGKTLLLDNGANSVAIVPCVDGSYAPAREVINLDDDDRVLFELLDPSLKVLARGRLETLCPSLIDLCDDITPARAIEIFESQVDNLSAAPAEVLEWLANHRGVFVDEATKERVRALPIYPSTSGELMPLTNLSLPSDFDDVLGVANVVDRDKVAGHIDLLHLLGARELEAVEYLTRHIVPASIGGHLSEDQASSMLEIIHRHRADLEQSPDARSALAQAPLVPTDQGLKPSVEVHLPNHALSLIDPEAPTVRAGLPPHLQDILVWLGVSRSPSHAVLSEAATRLADQEGQPSQNVVLAILRSLPEPPMSEEVPTSLRALTTSAWLPVEGGRRARPDRVYAGFQKYLFASQGPHLDLPQPDQQRLSEVLAWLGVQRVPTTAMVAAHLRFCSENHREVNEQVFRVLGEADEEDLVSSLRNIACVQVGPGEFVEPDVVFWTDSGLGTWARQLPPGHRPYQEFYRRVGVQESPTPEQVEQLLRRISRTIGNDRVEPQDQAVVHRCWELLQEHIEGAQGPLRKLGAVKSALGPRGLLEKPELLLFVDGRRLAEKIPLIKDNLIKRDRLTQRALEAAGARPAEDVITAHVDDELPQSPADVLRALIRDRLPALERLVEAQRSDDATFDLDTLGDLQIDLMPELAVEYVTRFGGTVWVDSPQPTEAIYLQAQHRLIANSEQPTRHLARELALCIAPQADASATAPSIVEILSAKSLDEAMTVLDEYGVRNLYQSTWDQVPTSTADDMEGREGGREPESQWNGLPAGDRGADDPEKGAENQLPTGHGDDATGGHPGPNGSSAKRTEQDGFRPKAMPARQPSTNTSRLTSYVSNSDTSRDSDQGDEANDNSSIDRAGVRRVLEYEKSCGRLPEEQSHTNPGFDLLSKNADGVLLRRIEVKSIGGAWTDRGVLLSSTQFRDAQANSDVYWLYVVEHAEDDDAAVIHRIQNPAGQVTKFGFDGGWRALEEPDIPRNDEGRPDVLTRRLLGWGSTARSDD